MIKYSLKCQDCSFEFDSWFSSSKEFDRLKKLKFINCETCGSLQIEKSLMAPNLSNTKKMLAYLSKHEGVKTKIEELQEGFKKTMADESNIKDKDDPYKTYSDEEIEGMEGWF